MPKRILLFVQLALFLTCAASPDSRAQTRRPSQALRQLTEHRQKLSETLQRDAEKVRERSPSTPVLPPDPDGVDEALIKFAAELAAGFKVEDWKGEELRALGELYQTAEQFAPAAEAFRAYLKDEAKSQSGRMPNVRARLILAMIEAEQLDEAEKSLEGDEWIATRNPGEVSARTGIYRNLSLAFRDRGLYEKAAAHAEKGYRMVSSLILSGNLPPFMLERTEQNLIALAAVAVAAHERLGRKKEADDLNKLAIDTDFERRPELRSVYESELAAARLIGTAAPELEVSQWIEGAERAPKSLAGLRGNVVLLYFWAMWSEPFVNSAPRLRGFESKFAGLGFEIVGLTKFYGRSDTEEALSREQEIKSLQNFRTRHQLRYPFAVGKMDDVTNEERYGVAVPPTMVLIDRRGYVRNIKRGVGEYRKLERQIEKLIGEK